MATRNSTCRPPWQGNDESSAVVNRAWYIPLCLFVAIYCVLCAGLSLQWSRSSNFSKTQEEWNGASSKRRRGDKIVRTRVRYIFENRTYNSERCCLSRAHLPPPRSAMPPWRRLLYIVVLALLCFGGCSSPSFPVRYVRIPFGAIGKAGHARGARRFFRSGSSHDFSDCGVGGGSVSFSVTPE